MKTSLSPRKELNTLLEVRSDSFFKILSYENLGENKKLKQLKINLDDSMVKVREDKLFYLKGQISKYEIYKETSFAKKIFSLTEDEEEEESIYPIYSGSGEIMLDTSLKDFVIIGLEDDEIIIKEDSFWVCESEVNIDYEGEDELLLYGNGIVVIEVPVSEKEILRQRLNKNTIKVFKNDIIFRRGNFKEINHKEYKVYEGTGEIWLTPTRNIGSNPKRKNEILFAE